jgi:hypothetical protein
MKAAWGLAVLLVLSAAAIQLSKRWREESADTDITLLVDWQELRDSAVRQALTDQVLLERVRNAGANALLVGAATVRDYARRDFTFSSLPFAETVLRQLSDRGVVNVTLKREAGKFRLISPSQNWERLQDLEVGFDPEFMGKARQAGFHLVLRVNNDPWLSRDKLFSDLQEVAAANQELGFLLNTDEVPGGTDALPSWVAFLENQNYSQLLFEFHPTKSSLKLGARTPRSTYRAHTIAPNELKELSPAQEQSRWHRAVQERSCRFLLVHMSPNDALPAFFETLYSLRQDLQRDGWKVGWPRPRIAWSVPSSLVLRLRSMVALLLAIALPMLVLRVTRRQKPSSALVQIFILTLLGACVVAAAADNPLTRIQITPFRGIKAAFALGWLGCFATLYSWKEIESQLYQTVRRVDVLVALAVLAVVGYMWIRMGNAGAGWKVGWEQSFRDRLEVLLIARPRFKEMAIGYPLLLVGLNLMASHKSKVIWQDGRLWTAIGMIGPLSMINTFCHLHSPLYLAFWRSVNGFVIGVILGLVLWAVIKKSGGLRLAA